MFNLVMKIMRNRWPEELEQVKLVLMEVPEVPQLHLVDLKLPVTEENMV